MKNKTGAMRYRIDVKEQVETLDDTGEPVVTWVDFLVEEPAEFIPTGGLESYRGKQLEAGTKAIFRVRYREGYTTQMSFIFDGTRYGITHINPVDGMRRYLDLLVAT